VFFQGGLAMNRAVGCAMVQCLGKKVAIPPHPELLGAVGVALLALEKAKRRFSRRPGGPGDLGQACPERAGPLPVRRLREPLYHRPIRGRGATVPHDLRVMSPTNFGSERPFPSPVARWCEIRNPLASKGQGFRREAKGNPPKPPNP